jgi:voltage-gated potassium channel
VNVQPGLVGGTIVIIVEALFVTGVLCLRYHELLLGVYADHLSVVVTSILLPLVIIAFLYFLASFSGQEGRRPWIIVMVFVVCNIATIILLFANLYAWTGIGYGSDDDHPISTLPECIYFSVVTLTTVGYGDFHPVSGTARIVAGIEALSGYIILGVLVSALINIFRPRL